MNLSIERMLASGREYKKAIIEHIDEYNHEWVRGEINRIENNEEISNSIKLNVLEIYKLKEDISKVLKEYDEKPKGTIQEITLGSLDETRAVGYNDYLVYSFSGIRIVSINVSLEVINGNAVDVFLLDSGQFTDYQSMMLGGSSEAFRDYAVGGGKNIKSKSYSFTFDHPDKYYIIIDNTDQPKDGAKPSGSADVKIKIMEETQQSTPGFEFIYSILLFTVVFYLLKKD